MSYRLHLLILFFFINTTIFFAQQKEYNEVNLVKVIKEVENSSGLIFNYDPALLSNYYFTGKLITDNPEKLIEKLFYDTPFDFEVTGKSVVVYLPEKKEYRICGTVLDAANLTPLMLSNIYADDQVHGTQSTENGFFDFYKPKNKNQKIHFQWIEYRAPDRRRICWKALVE